MSLNGCNENTLACRDVQFERAQRSQSGQRCSKSVEEQVFTYIVDCYLILLGIKIMIIIQGGKLFTIQQEKLASRRIKLPIRNRFMCDFLRSISSRQSRLSRFHTELLFAFHLLLFRSIRFVFPRPFNISFINSEQPRVLDYAIDQFSSAVIEIYKICITGYSQRWVLCQTCHWHKPFNVGLRVVCELLFPLCDCDEVSANILIHSASTDIAIFYFPFWPTHRTDSDRVQEACLVIQYCIKFRQQPQSILLN